MDSAEKEKTVLAMGSLWTDRVDWTEPCIKVWCAPPALKYKDTEGSVGATCPKLLQAPNQAAWQGW